MAKARKIIVAAVAVGVGAFALPVHGFFQVHSFFNASNKYRQWFHETEWLQDTRAAERRRGIRKRSIATNTALKYPYPDKPYVPTYERWRESFDAIEYGKPEWHHVEVVRQRAELEEYAPAMDFLGWMYEGGRGLEQDYRKAYMWYERAKLAGKENLRADPAKIFQRLDQRERYFAELQLTEDKKYWAGKPKQKTVDPPPADQQTFETVKVRVFEEQRETEMLRKKLDLEKKRKAEEENN